MAIAAPVFRRGSAFRLEPMWPAAVGVFIWLQAYQKLVVCQRLYAVCAIFILLCKLAVSLNILPDQL
jgi:hypothetical protein